MMIRIKRKLDSFLHTITHPFANVGSPLFLFKTYKIYVLCNVANDDADHVMMTMTDGCCDV